MSIMPLHAAGRHSLESNETVLDRAMLSYSSSIRMLAYSRRREVNQPLSPRVREKALLVSMELTPGGENPLKFATQEISMLRDLCEKLDLVPVEPWPRKRGEVLAHLSDCKIFHFAGHGYTDDYDPSQSCLLLEDLPLTLATLQETNLRERAPFLAYLSACGTGLVRHERFHDENLNLISGYQIAGFRHVVGTLWRVNDELSADMARITYEGLHDSNLADGSVCSGLHRATKEMRDRWVSKGVGEEGEKRKFREVTHRNQPPGSICDESRDHPMPSRTILPDDDDEEEELGIHDSERLQWVPYVHYSI